MTQVQENVLKEVWQKITEHFDSAILAIDTEANTPNTLEHTFLCNWHGGITASIGLSERAKARFVQIATSKPEDII